MTDSLRKLLASNEGRVSWMYLDTRRNVTIGVGHLIPDLNHALSLPFVLKRVPTTRALPDTIRNDWYNVKSEPAGKSAAYYGIATVTALTDSDIDSILASDVSLIQLGLITEFPSWDTFPPPAQTALTDMAFNLGVHGLVNKFPRLAAAVRVCDWGVCAVESKRGGISDARNDSTRDAFYAALAPASPPVISPS